jgi:glutaredoxin
MEKPKLNLYYLPTCPYSKQVLQYLEEIHKTVPLESLVDNPKGKQLLEQVGGQLKVPCLTVDARAIYDSGPIIDWLSKHQELLETAIN